MSHVSSWEAGGPAPGTSGGRIALALAIALAVPAPALPEVEIAHDGVSCMAAGSFPVIQARLQPVDEVARARVYFRARGTRGWYYVDMKGEGDAAFEGILPRPLDSLEAIDYYIETLDPAFTQGRSQEYSAQIITGSEACPAGRKTAITMASAPSTLLVGAPEGASAIPPGFSGVGLAAGGGIPVAVLAGIAVGAGAAVAVVVGTGGSGESGGDGGAAAPNGPAPVPTPAPTPDPVADISGRWAGSIVEVPSAVLCSVTSDLSLNLQQSGTDATGTFQLDVRTATPAPQDECSVQAGDAFSGPARATVSGSSVMLELSIQSNPPRQFGFGGTISENRMGGSIPPDAEGPGGSWEVTRQ